ncbi:MAG TPA: hypothetical protein VJ724_16215, partial [Tahibacter sp.]|nr:hypothetical protein [Tahibacter sp.]
WRFVDEPPADLATNDARRRDWSANAVKIVEAQFADGDAEAAFALGLAYAKDKYDEGWRGAPKRDAFDAALADQPAKAYEYLSLYLSTQPDPRRMERTQTLLAELDATTTPAERDDARRAAQAARERYFGGREN